VRGDLFIKKVPLPIHHMYYTETHLHTAETSPCGKLPAAEEMQIYHEAGYSTVFVTDHYSEIGFRMNGAQTLADRPAILLRGYRAAREAGEKLGMTVLLGAEIQLLCSPNHYLLYGADEAFFETAPDLLLFTPEQLYDFVNEHGFFLTQAHPFRGKCTPTPHAVHAMEAYNSTPSYFVETDEARVSELNRAYHLPLTGGSDCHRLEDACRTGIITKIPIRTASDFREVLRTGEFEIKR